MGTIANAKVTLLQLLQRGLYRMLTKILAMHDKNYAFVG